MTEARIGHGRAHGAITVVNAIATGRGAAIGIDLYTDATVTLRPAQGEQSDVRVRIENDPAEDPRLAEACIETVLRHIGLDDPFDVEVTTRSSIPVSRGLKSSSAAANAIVLATLAACGRTVGDEDGDDVPHLKAVGLAVDAALAAGVTITGAFDDATASYFGGLVCTDNANRQILHTEPVEGLEIILVVPSAKVRTIDTATAPTHPIRHLVREAHEAACRGEWQDAMLRNSLAYGAAYGQSNRLVLSMLDTGALAAGISGTGPAQAVVIRQGDWDCFTGIIGMQAPEATVLVAHTNHQRASSSREPLAAPAAPQVIMEGGP